MTRPVPVLRHALQRPLDHRRKRWSPLPLVGALAVLLATLAAAVIPASDGPVALGPVTRVAMSNAEMSDRAEWDSDYARQLGHRMARDFGFKGDHQWHCLRRLWRRESSWRVHADNHYSAAYGIPQANPGSKMSTAGDHWKRNAETQIRWGLRYIHNRYERPCGAWGHSQRTGWY